MATEQLSPSPPAKKRKQSPGSSPATIMALGDDVLREIFLRLPSLATLVRAALTCRAFLRAVRSFPAFRRRFRELHPPPLLGLFLDTYGAAIPVFAPLRGSSDPDIAAAIRGADFFLTRLPDGEGAASDWAIRDCRDGYVVLISFNSNQMAVYNPLTRALDLLPQPPGEICEDMYVEFHILSSQEDPRLFRVVCVSHERWGAQAAVLSSDTRQWQIFPWVGTQCGNEDYSTHDGTLVSESIYWTNLNRASVRELNTTTLQFSQFELPLHMDGQGDFMPGETKDGRLCIVCAVQLTLVVWFWRADADGVDRWMQDMTFPLLQAIDEISLRSVVVAYHDALKIVAIVDGFVYMCTYSEMDHSLPGWFLSLCLETAELNKICPILQGNASYPYIMPWPPSLLCNQVNL